MKVCITSAGMELDSPVDARFGRSPYFIIVDTETDDVEAFANTCSEQAQGAGTGAAALLVDKGIEVLLTGRIGPKALAAFQATDIRLVEGISSDQTGREALAKFAEGKYQQPPMSAQPAGGMAEARGSGAGVGAGRGMGCGRGMGRGGGRGMGGGRKRRS
jgi:predicted Fe-Mo cluster-binding NifX family protein